MTNKTHVLVKPVECFIRFEDIVISLYSHVFCARKIEDVGKVFLFVHCLRQQLNIDWLKFFLFLKRKTLTVYRRKTHREFPKAFPGKSQLTISWTINVVVGTKKIDYWSRTMCLPPLVMAKNGKEKSIFRFFFFLHFAVFPIAFCVCICEDEFSNFSLVFLFLEEF